MRKLNLEGKKFHKLTVVSFAESRNKARLWNCICECGRTTITKSSALIRGESKSCGCSRKVIRKKSRDLIGKTFNYLTAISEDNSHKRNKIVCECICGKIVNVNGTELKNGRIKSCGCKQRKIKDLVGQKFGLLIVLEKRYHINFRYYWNCLCKCGTEKVIRGSHLIDGKIKSCGCIKVNKRPGIIYGVRNPGEDFVYIGQTIRKLEERLVGHTYTTNGLWTPFQLWLKDNPNAEIIAIHENVPYDELNYLEQETIKKYDNLLNVCYN